MKKTSKILAVVLATLLVVAAVVVLASCGANGTASAYGLVHGKGYVGKGTVTVKGGVIIDASLDEAVFPNTNYAKASETQISANADYVTSDGYWKTVKWGSVEAKWSDSDKSYKVGSKLLKDYFLESEANCEAYFEAAANDQITVVTADGDKTDILTSQQLLKTNNGYWDGESIHEGQLGWKVNVEKTVNYVIEYGIDDAIFTTVDKIWTDGNGVSTGATWTDMADYVRLLAVANYKASYKDVQMVTGEYKYENAWVEGAYYGAMADVFVSNGKVVGVILYSDRYTGWTRTTSTWTENQNEGDLGYTKAEQSYAKYIQETFVGKSVDEVNAYSASYTPASKSETGKDVFTVSDEAKLAGATQSAVRIVLAVQNALSKLAK